MVVVQGKAVLFKSAIDKVFAFYVSKYTGKGLIHPDTRGNGKVSDFSYTYVNPRKGRTLAILSHPIVFARYKIEETKLMRVKAHAIKAEIFEWPQKTLTEQERFEVREIGYTHSSRVNTWFPISCEATVATILSAPVLAALFSTYHRHWIFQGIAGGITIGLVTFLGKTFEHYVNRNNKIESGATEVKG
ncbi:MAG: hypothetical protein Q7S22_05450 [Candidatus Micrarchaeota archaeon]|nr:hypothetical protein [Candidatus Micrarchaeota archaeon]